MNNDIQEPYCSLEVCKLLKEKGFNVFCNSFYTEEGDVNLAIDEYNILLIMNWQLKKEECSFVSQALAIEWIRVNFDLHIHTYPTGMGYYCYEVFSIKRRENPKDKIVQKETTSIQWDELYNTPQEATEAALLYTLKNLI